MDDFNFDQFDDIVKQNFYSDDFAHFGGSLDSPDMNGQVLNIFPDSFGLDDTDYSSDDSESFDFI